MVRIDQGRLGLIRLEKVRLGLGWWGKTIYVIRYNYKNIYGNRLLIMIIHFSLV